MAKSKLTDIDESPEFLRLILDQKAKQFDKTKNPVFAIEVFLLSRQLNVSLPETVAAWFTACLLEWHDEQGTKSLDRIMQLKLKGGKFPPYKALLLEERDEMLFTKMVVLQCLGTTVARSAEIVSRGLEEAQNWNKSRWKLPRIDAEWLAEKYAKWEGRRSMQRDLNLEVQKWTPRTMYKFLSQYPYDSLTDRLKEIINALRKSGVSEL